MSNILFPNGALIFDIGAEKGGSVNKYCNLGAGKCISVEPCLENYLSLLKMAERHKQTVPIHAACWSETGLTKVRLSVKQPGLSSVVSEKWAKAYPDAEWGPVQIVPTITIDTLATYYGKPAFVKIDTEGSEYECLRGMSFKPETLSFEFHRFYADDTEVCLKRLWAMGFTKACFVETDVNPEINPTMPIREFVEYFRKTNPLWGNITVI